MVPPPAPILVALGISDATIHALVASLTGVVAEGVGYSLPSPSPSATAERVADLSFLHLRFACGISGDGGLLPIWE